VLSVYFRADIPGTQLQLSTPLAAAVAPPAGLLYLSCTPTLYPYTYPLSPNPSTLFCNYVVARCFFASDFNEQIPPFCDSAECRLPEKCILQNEEAQQPESMREQSESEFEDAAGVSEQSSEDSLPTDDDVVQESGHWSSRIFVQGFTPEDLILYVLSLVLIVSFWIAFDRAQAREGRLIQSISDKVIEDWRPTEDLDDLDLNHMRAQVVNTALRYHLATVSTAAISTRKNLGFLVGTIVTIIGCIIVIRGVRRSAIRASVDAPRVKTTFATSSPGIFIVLLGALILGYSIHTAGERPRIEDAGILCVGCQLESGIPAGADDTGQEGPLEVPTQAAPSDVPEGIPMQPVPDD
jgi:hypothetical protein